MSNATRTEHALDGIKCGVVNCEYHGEHSCCMASNIDVETKDPIQQTQVECKTFKPKAGR